VDVAFKGEPLKILDFDIECRPLSWYGGDWVTKEVTAIAWAWVNDSKPKVTSIILGDPFLVEDMGEGLGVYRHTTVRDILEAFVPVYDEADMVTGHFIRGFDLPVLNGALFELEMPLLSSKLSHDTKGDLKKFSGLSKSQENLGATLGLDHPKVSMNQDKWRRVNRGEADAIREVKERVEGDVLQHIEMRRALLDRGMLGYPRVWNSTPTRSPKYVP
jgi:hypothetical protein